jgi:hypothetical protein
MQQLVNEHKPSICCRVINDDGGRACLLVAIEMISETLLRGERSSTNPTINTELIRLSLISHVALELIVAGKVLLTEFTLKEFVLQVLSSVTH